MSKLKVAKAVQASIKVAKWVGIGLAVLLVLRLLWLWASVQFLSFAIVIGVILALLLIAATLVAYEWSVETIEEAKKEEREAQERERRERIRKEHPDVFPTSSVPYPWEGR